MSGPAKIFIYDGVDRMQQGDRTGRAIREDGVVLADHVSSSWLFVQNDLGPNGFYTDKYEQACPNGYTCIFVEAGKEDQYPGFPTALERSRPEDPGKILRDDPPALVTLLIQRALENGLHEIGRDAKAIRPGEYVIMHASVADVPASIDELGITVQPGDIIPVIRRADHETSPAPLWGPPETREQMPKEPLEISFKECARCGADHEKLVAVPFQRPPEHWSHWTKCPGTHEPILVASGSLPAVGLVNHGSPLTAADQFDAQARAAFEAGLAGNKLVLDTETMDLNPFAQPPPGLKVVPHIGPRERALQELLARVVPVLESRRMDTQFDVVGLLIQAEPLLAGVTKISDEAKADHEDQVELSKQIADEVIAEEKELAALRIMAGAVRDLLEQWDAGEHDLMPKLNELKRKYDLVEATK